MKKQTISDIAASFENAVADVLVYKTKIAMNLTKANRLVLVGGVSANSYLRYVMSCEMRKIDKKVFFVKKEFCTDNAAMIALSGYLYLKKSIKFKHEMVVDANWSISEI